MIINKKDAERFDLKNIIDILKKYKNTTILILFIFLASVIVIHSSGVFSPKTESYIRFDDFKTPTVNIKYTYHNDKIIKQEAMISTPYDLLKKTKIQTENSYSGIEDQLKNIKGISVTTKFEEGVVLEKVIVNFNKVSKADLKRYQKIMKKDEIPVNLEKSMKASEKLLKKVRFLSLQDYSDKKEEQQP